VTETTRHHNVDARPGGSSSGERLHHAGLVVADLDRSVGFYRDLLGLPLLEQGRESSPVYAEMFGVDTAVFRWAELDVGGGHVLELIRYEPPAGGGAGVRGPSRSADDDSRAAARSVPGDGLPPARGHIALRVADAEAAYRALSENGATVLSRPVRLQEDNHWHGAQAFYVYDPDGYLLELVQEARA